MTNWPDSQRVVVTGLGAITSLGQDPGTFWKSLQEGKNGVSRVEAFDTSDFTCKIGAEIKNFDAAQFMDPKEVRRNDRYVHFAFIAAKQAVVSASGRKVLPG